MTLRPVARHGAIRIGALITSACIAGGFAVATVTLRPLGTPADVTQAFVEAKYAEDWSAAWDLMCRTGRNAFGSYSSFTEWADYQNEYVMRPSDADVEIVGVEDVRQPGAVGFGVAYRVTSDERSEAWAARGEALVVREDGEFRVCVAARVADIG